MIEKFQGAKNTHVKWHKHKRSQKDIRSMSGYTKNVNKKGPKKLRIRARRLFLRGALTMKKVCECAS